MKVDLYMAAIMSMIIPGLGQYYCALGMKSERGKQYVKCFIFISLIFLALFAVMMFSATVLIVPAAIVTVGVWVLNIVDAVQTSRLVNEGRYKWRFLVLSVKDK